MFPNVRLMIVAILAAIAGIGCGLGLFATFRVNHEPLARLAEGSPPLQLALDNRAPGSDARVPLEARLPVNGAPKPIFAPVIIATPSPEPNAAPSATPSATPSAAAEQSEADSPITADSSAQQESAGAAAADQSKTASLAVPTPAEQSSVTSEATGRQEAVAPDQPPAVAVAPAPATEQMAAINAVAEDTQPVAQPTKAEAGKAATKPAARAARAAPARRAAKTVRARRAVAKLAAQPTYRYAQPAYSQPAYAWVDGAAQASQPVKRLLIKRHRAAKKVTPAAQSDVPAATAGLSGTQ